jgi:hypothetical protein
LTVLTPREIWEEDKAGVYFAAGVKGWSQASPGALFIPAAGNHSFIVFRVKLVGPHPISAILIIF